MALVNDGDKPLAQWTMTTRSHGMRTESNKDNVTTEVVNVEGENKTPAGFVAGLRKRPSRKCTLPTIHKHGWKPETMRAPVLLSFAAASFLIAILLEVLAQQSQKAGGLSLVKEPKSLPPMVTFAYLYLPTIVAVIYSLAWSWVDLDVKRMQPWLNLSTFEGGTADNTIFLDYPYYFFAWVPFKAASKRHWIVCSGGSITMLIMLVITPLQSAVIGASSIKIDTNVTFANPTQLMAVDGQGVLLDTSVLNRAFAITWLEQTYPAFTTKDYVLLPMNLGEENIQPEGAKNWTGTTTQLSTELNCWNATMKRDNPWNKGTYNFDNGQGCNISQVVPLTSRTDDKPYRILYIGYHNSAYADYGLSSPTCSKNSTHQFLAIWAKFRTADTTDVVSMFCETSYFKQNISVTVDLPSYTPQDESLEPVGEKEPLSVNEFNITAFEYLLGAGVSEVTKQRDWPAAHLMEQYPRLVNDGMAWPVSPMVGFAVGAQNQSVKDLNDENLLTDSFRKAHKTLFGVAVNTLLSNATKDVVGSTEGVVHSELYGVVVSRSFSIALEVLLALVGLLTIAIWRLCQRSPSKLSQDPSSVGALMQVVQNSPDLLHEFFGRGGATEEELRKAFTIERFCLQCACENPSNSMVITLTKSPIWRSLDQRDNLYPRELKETASHYRPLQPIALRKSVGVGFSLIIVTAIVTLSYFKSQEKQLGGLIRPSESFEVLQLLESVLPTMLATLIEPFWILLNRFLCIVQPFKDMWDRKPEDQGTVRARYTSVPPQLVIWRALRAKHIILVIVCLVALLSNILAVGLGGLFNELPTSARYPVQLQPLASPRLDNSSLAQLEVTSYSGNGYEDHFYAALANLTTGTALPPWVSQKYYFQPFMAVNSSSDNHTETFNGITHGYGMVPSCQPMKAFGQPPSLDFRDFKRENNITDAANCLDVFQPDSIFLNRSRTYPRGPAAAEVLSQLEATGGPNPCQKVFISGWGRTVNGSDHNGTIDSMFLACYPRFQTAKFNVTVDAKGRILSALPISEFRSDLDYEASQNHTDNVLIVHNKVMLRVNLIWHNDTTSRDWLNHLIKVKMNNDTALNGFDPLPTPETIIPVFEDVYTRLFALLMGLNSYIFQSGENVEPVPGYRLVPEVRIFMSNDAFYVSIIILVFNLVTAILFYGYAIRNFLPRLPTTIGSVIAYVAPSQGVKEYSPEKNMLFWFGRYVGDDGRAHIGIEKSQLVVPLDLSALYKGDTAPVGTRFGKVWRRKNARKAGDTWL